MAEKSLKLSDIAAELMDVASDEKTHIISEIYGLGENASDPENGIHSMDDYTRTYDTPNEVIMTKISVKKGLKPGGKKVASGKVFNPSKDAIVVKPHTAKVEHISLDYFFEQEEIINLYKSYLHEISNGSVDANEVPFGKYLLDDALKKCREELRIAYFQAVHNQQGDNYLALFNGWLYLYNEGIVSGKIAAGNIVDVAAFTPGNGVGEIEKIVDVIPTHLLKDIVCLTNTKVKKCYERDYRTKYGTLPYNQATQKAKIDGTSIPFYVEPGMDGYDLPMFIHKKNLARLYDSNSSMTTLEVDYEKRERNIAVVMDCQAGAGINDYDYIWGADDGVSSLVPDVEDPEEDPEGEG